MAGLQVEERAKYGQVFETLRPVDGRLHGDKVRPVSFPDRDFSCIVYFLAYSHTHTHPFNGPFSGTTRVSRYQKGKTNLDFIEARDSEWQWRQLGHMQVCT